MNHPIIRFYLGEAPDDRGRRIAEIWGWTDCQLEGVHDYVQWLFPSPRPSDYNPTAPVLSAEVAAAFGRDPELRARLLRSFERMLSFYGFSAHRAAGGLVIERGENWPARRSSWVTPGNHNFLRITRILVCLRGIGCQEEAFAFHAALQGVSAAFPEIVGERTARFWRSAAHDMIRLAAPLSLLKHKSSIMFHNE